MRCAQPAIWKKVISHYGVESNKNLTGNGCPKRLKQNSFDNNRVG
jgi:hypothetical protein